MQQKRKGKGYRNSRNNFKIAWNHAAIEGTNTVVLDDQLDGIEGTCVQLGLPANALHLQAPSHQIDWVCRCLCHCA